MGKPLIYLLGDKYKAQSFLWFAERKLTELKNVMGLINTRLGNKFYTIPGGEVTVYIESYLGNDKIRIIAKKCIGWELINQFGVRATGGGPFTSEQLSPNTWFDLNDNYFYVSTSAAAASGSTRNPKINIYNRKRPYDLVKHIDYLNVTPLKIPRGITVDTNFFYVVASDRLDIYSNASPFDLVDNFDITFPLGAAAGDIVVDDNFIYISTRRNDDVEVYDKTSPYDLVNNITGFNQPRGLTLNSVDDTDNNLYVCNSSNVRIVNKTTGVEIAVFGSFFSANAIAVDKSRIYVTETVSGICRIFSINSPYTLLESITRYAPDPGFNGVFFDIQRKGGLLYLSSKQLDSSYKPILWLKECS